MNTTHIKAGPAINQGGYSFERDARPVWRDTSTGELCGFPDFADTQPATMDAAELKVDQMRAPAAPRIPRVHRLVGVDMAACTGDCAQGRRPCSGHGECNSSILADVDESIEYSRLWWFVMVVLFCIAAAFALSACGGGGDSGSDEQDQRGTVQPVDCAASGCAR